MRISKIEITDNPFLGNLDIDLVNPKSGFPYSIIILVGDNGLGKTQILKSIYKNDSQIVLYDSNNKIIRENNSLYLEQNLPYVESLAFALNLIDGSTPKCLKNSNFKLRNLNIQDKENLIKIIKDFDDQKIINLFLEGTTLKQCWEDIGGKLLISKSSGEPYYETYSSGEAEIFLKIETLKENLDESINTVLIDELETGLHPKWQTNIYKILKKLLSKKDTEADIPDDLQIFISTHSESILRSVVADEDVLIIGLKKNDDLITISKIDKLDLKLPIISSSEINYLIFDMISAEYLNELYGELLIQLNKKNQKDIDQYLLENFGEAVNNKYGHQYNNRIESIPTYIRNALDHRETYREYKEEDLREAIEILRKALK